MRTDDLLSILKEFHHGKLAMRQRHAAVAKQVRQYEANNTYQYVINREDLHLSWLEAAIRELGGAPDEVAEPAVPALRKKDSFSPFVTEDAKQAAAFVAAWRPRLASVTHARHRGMMQVILGETVEQQRFFDHIVAGRRDELGRRSNGPGSPGTGDGVLGVRWIG